MSGGQMTEIPAQEAMLPEQTGLIKQLSGLLSGQVGQGVDPYGGQLVAGIPSQLRYGMGMLGDIGQAGRDVLGAFNPTSLLGAGAGALQDVLGGPDLSEIEGLWKRAFVKPAMANYKRMSEETVGRFAGMNAYRGGGLGEALGRQLTDVNTNIDAQLAQMLFGSQEAGLGRQMQAIGQTPGFAGAPFGLASQAAQGQIGAGQLQRGIEQQGLSAEHGRWLSGQPYQNPFMKSFLGPALSQGTMMPGDMLYEPPWWQSAIGAVGEAAGPIGSAAIKK